MKIRYYEINNKYINKKKTEIKTLSLIKQHFKVFLTTIYPTVRHDRTSKVQCSFININYVIKY